MKNFFKWLGVIALVVTIGFGFIACDDGSTGGGNSNPFLGTWINSASGFTITFTSNTNWVMSYEGTFTGTYTYNGNNATLYDEGDTITAVIAGNNLTLILEDGTALTLTRGSGSGGGSKPAAPTGVTATAVSSSAISLSWNAVSGATGYYVYNSLSSSGFELLTTEYTTGITNYNLPANTVIYYQVSAFNANGESARSNTVSARTLSGSQNNTSLNGVWARADGNIISILGSDGYFTVIDSGWQRVQNNGDIRIGSTKFRNINSAGNLTWSAQELSYDPNTYHVRSWDNCTITMASNGNTFTTSNDPSIIYTRRDNNQLNGIWDRGDGNVISIIDSNGYFTVIDSGWKRVEDNGDIKIGSAKFRNINSAGNLTWSAQELSYDPNTYHVRSWDNCTITMASNGNTFTTSNDPSITYTRRR